MDSLLIFEAAKKILMIILVRIWADQKRMVIVQNLSKDDRYEGLKQKLRNNPITEHGIILKLVKLNLK